MTEPRVMKTKKEHYVTQNYLKAFARGGQLNVFDKTTGAIFTSSVRDTASSRFFYDIPELDKATGVSQALDKSFQPFEDAAAGVLNALRSSLGSGELVSVTQAQRIDLSLFLALQLIRTPKARKHFMQISLALRKELFLAWVREQRPGLQIDRDSFELEMTKDQQLRTHALHLLDHELRDRIAEIIYQHAWVILENPFPVPFICSDHPVCNHGMVLHSVRSMEGLTSLGAEILFPLSPTHLLLIVDRRAFPQAARLDGRLSVLNAHDNVVYYNHWQIRHSFRFLYSIEPEFSLARAMIEEYPELSNPRNHRIRVYGPAD